MGNYCRGRTPLPGNDFGIMAWDLKNEEDVKQYLDNLGTEYRFGCYSEKKPEGKVLVSDLFGRLKKN